MLQNMKGKDKLVRNRSRWEDNIKTDLNGIWCGNVDWIHLSYYGALVNTVMNFRVPIKGNEFLDELRLCSMVLVQIRSVLSYGKWRRVVWHKHTNVLGNVLSPSSETKINQENNESEEIGEVNYAAAVLLVAWLILRPWRWKQKITPKRQ
jgi:hypothetical protein